MANGSKDTEAPIIRIVPPRRGVPFNLPELWRYRELLYFLIWRDVKVKYKQALLGFLWAIIVPVTQMVIFGTIFGRIAPIETNRLNPYIFYLAGLVPWQYFAGSLQMSSNSLVGYSHLLTKIYLPRLFVPLGSCIANFVDFAIAFCVLIALMLVMGYTPAATTLFMPLLMAIAFITVFGAGLILSAMNVKYRDIKFVVQFLTQIWMYMSVLLPFSNLPERWGAWRYLYGLNPMAGVVEGSRWCLLHHNMFVDEAGKTPTPAPWLLILVGLPVAFGLLFFGLFYFKRMEKMFADLV